MTLRNLAILIVTIGVASLGSRFLSSRSSSPDAPTPIWKLTEDSGQFEFIVYPSGNGHHYNAKLLKMPFPAQNADENGELPTAAWNKLASFKPETQSPTAGNQEWGTLEREGLTVKLTSSDTAALEKTIVGEVRHRLIMRAKRL